ncbi:HpcH/HpaI aldolase/citrate lyase family protein [Noviherbaspirillum massiliense]|uniref:HpcH/HpaI aldolase/citrate lyase family protein n=1 Tax=Noviherbaspirillum massiliense TaxID=1465823 RepID=UPI0002F488C8|nr:CoA ester lyase [Noviherbaspirillum massiliense]
MQEHIPRSYLFVPGDRPERYAKALASGAHAVIVDLEDAVPISGKAAAREALAAFLNPASPVLIRINGAQTEWFRDDLELCSHPGVAGIMLPKCERTGEAELVAECLRDEQALLPIIESAHGFSNALEIGKCAKVSRLIFGALDFQVDLGISGDGEELLYFRSQLVLASRMAGIGAPVDGPTTVLDNEEAIRAETLRARRIGFGGKLCIHPKQVVVVNECFRPTAEEVAWATRVMDASSGAQGAAVAVDGRMVDRPVILKAEAILAETRRPV